MREAGELIDTLCPICRSDEHENVWEHDSGIANGVCLRCGHVRLTRVHEIPTGELYANFRQSYDAGYLLDPANTLFKLARQRADLLRSWLPNLDSVLEIGSGYGHFLATLTGATYKAGLEPSEHGAEFARRHFDIPEIRRQSFEDVGEDWPGRAADAVCAFHVVEHLRDPFRFLDFCRRRLRPGGLVVIACPELHTLNPDLIELYFLRRQWHVHTFSETSLRNLLGRAGFEVVGIEREAPTPMLRSSIVAVARWRGAEAELALGADTVIDHRAALMRFHDRLEIGLASLRAAAQQWSVGAERVAIYGAGLHTTALFELSRIPPESITVLIDDDPQKTGGTICGVPVARTDDVLGASQPPDLILVSTLAAEHLLLDRLNGVMPAETRVLGVYRDFIQSNATV